MRSGVALSTSSGMLGCSTARQVHGVPKCTTTHTKWARETNENYQQWRQCTDRDTEFWASFFCHFKKLQCKSVFIVNVTFKSQILKLIFCSRQSHVNQNRRKR
jgi:hypothetical protein